MTYRPTDFDAHQKMISTTSLITGLTIDMGLSDDEVVAGIVVTLLFLIHFHPMYTLH